MDRLINSRYRLLEPLGTGGMGTVWRARDELLHRAVAVKEVLLPAGGSEVEREQLRERTRREARAAARLDSPHIVTVYDVVEQGGQPFLVLELVEARSLAAVLMQDGPLAPGRVAEIGLAVLSALETAHAQGIVHRDVKPGNVLLRPDGRVVLSDFGIAHAPGDAALTGSGLLLGSASYIAPERARGQAPGPASDLWSLGATLFAAVEGRPAFDTGEPLTTMAAVVGGVMAPHVHAGPLVVVLDGLLERDPQLRLDAARTRTALEVVATAGPDSSCGIPWVPEPSPPARRRGLSIVAALALVALAGAGGWVASNQAPGPAGSANQSGPPTAEGVAVPAEWQTYRGAGWTIRYPPGWRVGDYRGQLQLRDEVTHRTVRIAVAAAGGSPLTVLTGIARGFASTYPSYQELRLEQREAGATWEFTYTDQGADLHASDHAVTLGDRGFTVFTQSTATDWGPASAVLTTVAASLHGQA